MDKITITAKGDIIKKMAKGMGKKGTSARMYLPLDWIDHNVLAIKLD